MRRQDLLKQQAAVAAAGEVEDGMVLGLGTGSTAELVLRALALRVAGGLRILGIPTSNRTAALAVGLGIPLTDFAAHQRLDLTIDGADEVEPEPLAFIKGWGGALLREKIVATASRRMIVVVDESKIVAHLGQGTLPVEIAAFGWQSTLSRLTNSGSQPLLRRSSDGMPFVTDGGNYIADCELSQTEAFEQIDRRLRSIVGVVETGLFLQLASRVIIGCSDGIRILNR